MADDSPPSSPSPPPTSVVPGVLGADARSYLQKHCRVDLDKLNLSDPKNATIVAEIQKLAQFLFTGAAGGFVTDVKHFQAYTTNPNTNLGAVPYPAPIALGFSDFDTNKTPGFAGFSGWSFGPDIVQGELISQRLGRKIKALWVDVYIVAQWFQSAANVNWTEGFPPFKIIVARDKMTIAARPQNAPAAYTNQNDVNSVWAGMAVPMTSGQRQVGCCVPYNFMTHGVRYDMLYEKIYNAPANTNVANNVATFYAGGTKGFNFRVPLGFVIEYEDDNTSSPTYTFKNDFFIMFAVDNSIANLPGLYLDIAFDFAFKDIPSD